MSLTAFWLASRLGELISTNVSSMDSIRILTWEKIKIVSKDQLSIMILLPKVTEVESPSGSVLDLFSYEDKRYCPVNYMSKLHELCWVKGKGFNYNNVFQWDSGKLVTISAVNNYLREWLQPRFSDLQSKFSAHSFRAGLPSMMATCPDEFSEEDCQLAGRWRSNTVRRYTRQHGVAQAKVIKKFQSFLKKH